MASFRVVRCCDLDLTWRLFGFAAVVFVCAKVEAADRAWRNPDGGTFSSASNWSGGVPGASDVAGFGLSTPGILGALPPYTVSFTADATNQSLRVLDDRVTFDLNGHVYTTSDASVAMQLGTVSGASGRLGVLDGIVILPFQSDLQIATTSGGSGLLAVAAGGLVIGSPELIVGLNGNGTLNIFDNGDLIADNTTIAANSGTTSTANITGSGSSLLASALVVGSGGNATLNINASGRVDSTSGVLGDLVGSTGIANVDGVNSRWKLSSGLAIGRSGTGALNITGGGTVQSGGVLIAHRDLIGNPGTGAATVSGLNSQWIISGKVSVGINGVGTLDISQGGLVQSTSGEIGALGGGTPGSGMVHISDATSRWINAGELFVGASHMGTLLITGGQVQNSNGAVGAFLTGTGAVVVEGASSQWINLGDATIGQSNVGTLDITAGGRVESVNGIIGRDQGGDGRVTVDGANGISSWINSGFVAVGSLGIKATLQIKNGGQVQSASGSIGGGSTSSGPATVIVNGSNSEGFNSQWVTSGDLNVHYETGTLNITDGGRVENLNGTYGKLVTVSGPTSHWTNLGDLSCNFTSGKLDITSGGLVESVNGLVSGEVNITGPGSRWTNSGTFGVGSTFPGTLNITGGGIVQNTNASIGRGQNQTASTVNINGPSSQWINAGDLTVGGGGEGILNIAAGGRVQSVNGGVGVGNPNRGAFATVAGGGSSWNMSGRLSLKRGQLDIKPGGAVSVAGDTTLDSSSALNLQGGTLATSEIKILLAGGSFSWTSGTLHIGLFHDTLTVPNGGILAPGHSVGSTEIDGDYVQQNGSTLEIELGGIASADFVNVTSTAQLGGNLQLKFLIGGFILPPATTFVVFDSTGINGAFANVASGQRLVSADGRGSFVVNYGAGSPFDPTQIVLSSFLAAGLPGDYNENGVVDAADYTLWRNTLGSGTSLPNDETPGVGPDDYARWKTHFGQTAGSASVASANAAVPEPTTLVLVVIGTLVWIGRRTRDCEPGDIWRLGLQTPA